MKKKGIELEDTISYSESNLFTTKQEKNKSDINLITTSPDSISINPQAIETETDTETMIKPGKPKRKYTTTAETLLNIFCTQLVFQVYFFQNITSRWNISSRS